MVVVQEDCPGRNPLRGALAARAFNHLSLHHVALLGADCEKSSPNHRPVEKNQQVMEIMIAPKLVGVMTLHEQLPSGDVMGKRGVPRTCFHQRARLSVMTRR